MSTKDENYDLDEDYFVEIGKRTAKVPTGTHPAEILGINIKKGVESNFGGETKVRDVYDFEFGVNGSVVTRRFIKSMHELSALRKTIKTLTGEDLSEKYDVRSLIGLQCLVTIAHVRIDLERMST